MENQNQNGVDKAKMDRLRNMMKASVNMADVKQAQQAAQAQPLEVVATSIQKVEPVQVASTHTVDVQQAEAAQAAPECIPGPEALQQAGEQVLEALATTVEGQAQELQKEAVTSNPPAQDQAQPQEAPAKPARKHRKKAQAQPPATAPAQEPAAQEAPAAAQAGTCVGCPVDGPEPCGAINCTGVQQVTLEKAFQNQAQPAGQAGEQLQVPSARAGTTATTTTSVNMEVTMPMQAQVAVIQGGEGSRCARLAHMAELAGQLEPHLDGNSLKQLLASGVGNDALDAILDVDGYMVRMEFALARLARIVEGNQPTQGAQ
jgi:hypothetical protein